MPRPRDSRFFGPHVDADLEGLSKEQKSRDTRRRRLEHEVFESATRNLDRPLLRPRTGTPLRRDNDAPANPHAANASGGPVVLPPATFADDELETF